MGNQIRDYGTLGSDPEFYPGIPSETLRRKIAERDQARKDAEQAEFLKTYMTNRAKSNTFTNAEEETKGALLCWDLIQKQFE